MPFHSCEPRKAMARSRPSCSTSTRRLSVELKPRAFTLKSFMPLWVMSTPGTACSAIGAWPVIDVGLQLLLRHHRDRRRRLVIRSGAREAPSTTISPREMITASSAASAVTVPPGSTTT